VEDARDLALAWREDLEQEGATTRESYHGPTAPLREGGDDHQTNDSSTSRADKSANGALDPERSKATCVGCDAAIARALLARSSDRVVSSSWKNPARGGAQRRASICSEPKTVGDLQIQYP
jgi:hypothetical protein